MKTITELKEMENKEIEEVRSHFTKRERLTNYYSKAIDSIKRKYAKLINELPEEAPEANESQEITLDDIKDTVETLIEMKTTILTNDYKEEDVEALDAEYNKLYNMIVTDEPETPDEIDLDRGETEQQIKYEEVLRYAEAEVEKNVQVIKDEVATDSDEIIVDEKYNDYPDDYEIVVDERLEGLTEDEVMAMILESLGDDPNDDSREIVVNDYENTEHQPLQTKEEFIKVCREYYDYLRKTAKCNDIEGLIRILKQEDREHLKECA